MTRRPGATCSLKESAGICPWKILALGLLRWSSCRIKLWQSVWSNRNVLWDTHRSGVPIIRKKLRCCFTKDSALLSPFFVALVVSRSVLPAALMQRQAAGSRFYFGLRFLFPPSPQLAPAANRCILQSLIIIDQPLSIRTFHFVLFPSFSVSSFKSPPRLKSPPSGF